MTEVFEKLTDLAKNQAPYKPSFLRKKVFLIQTGNYLRLCEELIDFSLRFQDFFKTQGLVFSFENKELIFKTLKTFNTEEISKVSLYGDFYCVIGAFDSRGKPSSSVMLHFFTTRGHISFDCQSKQILEDSFVYQNIA